MEKTVIDFGSRGEQDKWEIMNDAVMGGVSESRIEITEHRTAGCCRNKESGLDDR